MRAWEKIDISSSTIFRTILILVGFWVVYLIWDIVLMLFAAIIIASAIEPIANWAQRYRVPRAATVALVYGLGILVLLGLVTLLIDPLVTQVQQLTQAVPNAIGVIHEYVPIVPEVDRAAVVRSVQEGLTRFGSQIGNLGVSVFQGAGTVVSNFALVLFVFVLAFYLVVEKDALKKFVRLVTPREHVSYVEQAVIRAQRGVGRWVIAQLALGLIIGVLVGSGLWLMGVPYSLVLGLVAGVLEIVPVIGPIIAAIPGVAIGFTQSLVWGGAVLLFYVIVQQFENHVLVPNIMRRAVGLHPLVTILAVLLGARLIGVVGAILAVPLATVLSIFLTDIFSVPAEEELAG